MYLKHYNLSLTRWLLSLLQSLLMDGLVEENDVTKELLSAGSAVNANLARAR